MLLRLYINVDFMIVWNFIFPVGLSQFDTAGYLNSCQMCAQEKDFELLEETQIECLKERYNQHQEQRYFEVLQDEKIFSGCKGKYVDIQLECPPKKDEMRMSVRVLCK